MGNADEEEEEIVVEEVPREFGPEPTLMYDAPRDCPRTLGFSQTENGAAPLF
jgi:hypothetical protein